MRKKNSKSSCQKSILRVFLGCKAKIIPEKVKNFLKVCCFSDIVLKKVYGAKASC